MGVAVGGGGTMSTDYCFESLSEDKLATLAHVSIRHPVSLCVTSVQLVAKVLAGT